MEFYFKDNRLLFSVFGDSIVRIVSYSSYILLGASAFMLSFSDIPRLRFFGLLMILFLGDRIIQLGKGERTVSELNGDRVNIARTLTPRSIRVLESVFRSSRANSGNFYLSILLELLRDAEVRHILKRLDVTPKEFLEKTLEVAAGTKIVHTKESLHGIIEQIALKGYRNAVFLNENYVEPRNLFVAISEEKDPDISKLFYIFNIPPEDVRQAALFSRHRELFSGIRRIPSSIGEFAHIPRRKRARAMNRAWTARPTPILDSMSTDLTERAERGSVGFLIGHEREYKSLLQVISKPGKPNAILVGENGSGKSTVIERLAYAMVKDEVPRALFDKRLVSLDVSGILSGADEKEVSGRIRRMIDEVISAGNTVLVIPNAQDLFKTKNAKGMSPIDFLLSLIKEDEIPVICESSPKDFKTFIESRTDFINQFETVSVEEISEEEAARFLVYESVIIEREFKLFVTFRAVRKAVELAHRYFRNRMLPGSASDLLKQAAASAQEERKDILSDEAVVKVAEKISKIPIQRAEGAEVTRLLNLESVIHEKFVNQKEAVAGVVRSLKEYRSGLSRKGGPIASFLFVGPTGVGKTELAKIVAEIQFGSKELMRRFDMSEYRDKGSVQRLIGTPDGEKTGALTDAILQNPYSLILLDEFEKAHADILNLFLQVFDDGRLTDSMGRTVNFENTVIIATSNAGSDFIKTEIEKGTAMAALAEKIKRTLTEYFTPELLNRFSQVVVFRNLNPDELENVVALAFMELKETLEKSHGIILKPDVSAVKKIAELGWSPVFGARPLRGVLSERIRSVLAEKILKKEIARGNSIEVSCTGKNFEFSVLE